MKNPVKPSLPASNAVLKILSFVALLVLCVLFFLLMQQLTNLRQSANELAQTTQLRNELWLTLTKVKTAEARQHGFLLTQDSLFLKTATNPHQELQDHLSDLRKKIDGNEAQSRRLDTLQSLVNQRLNLLDSVWALYKADPTQEAIKADLLLGKRLNGLLESHLRKMDSTEVQTLRQHTDNSTRSIGSTPRLATFLVLAALLTILFAFFRQRQLLKLAKDYLAQSLETGNEVKRNSVLLQQRTDLIESIVENSSDLVAVIDKDRKYTVWNKANEQQFGLSKADVIGRRIDEVFPFLVNDERWQYILDGLNGKAAYVKELPYFNKQKTAEFSYVPLTNAEGTVIGLLIMAHDITERKRAAEDLQRMIGELRQKNTELEEANAFNHMVTDLAPNNIVVYDAVKKKPIFLNRKAEETFGFTAAQLTQTGTARYLLEEFIHPDDLQQEWRKIEALHTAADGDVIESDCRLKNSRGEYRQMHLWRAVFKRSPIGKMEEYISISIDVTDIKKTETELQEKNRELQVANEEISAFNYIASHGLQEPMRKVQIFANVLEEAETNLTAKNRTYLQKIQAAAGRMRSLINDLLSFSQINMLNAALQPVDLNDVLAEAAFTLKAVLDAKEGRVEANELPVVQGVPFQLLQLVENLLSNSLKYGRPNVPPVITVTARRIMGEESTGLRKGQSYHHLRFADNGIGFKPEHGAKIFQMFERLHNMREYSGTGLGLAICKKVVQYHKGFIKATGMPDEGAVVDVYLPAS